MNCGKMTALPWSSRCIKYLLFIFNLLFVITGVILLSVGATIHGIYGNYEHFLDSGYLSTSAFMIAIGLIIFFVAFLGCCGAVKENYCMIITFSCLMILIFIFELAGGISGYVLKDRTAEVIQSTLNASMHKYKTDNETAKTWDILQSTFGCCGINNYTDWLSATNGTPVSCCETTYGNLNEVFCNHTMDSFYHQSCGYAFGKFVSDHALTLGGVAITLAVVQLVGIVFSCHLSKQIRYYYNNMP